MKSNPSVDDREGYIGGSDAAVILGVSPWRTRMQLCAEKRGVSAQQDIDPSKRKLFYFGKLLEGAISQAVHDTFGLKPYRMVDRNGQDIFFRHSKHEFMGGHIDFGIEKTRAFLECKNVRFVSNEWGEMCDEPLEEDASARIPKYYLAQARHYLALLDYDYCFVAALFGGSELRLYRINRDDDAERVLITAESDFWYRYVQGDDLPEQKTAEDYSLALSLRKEAPVKRPLVLNQSQLKQTKRLNEIRKLAKSLDEEAKVIRDELIVAAAGYPVSLVDADGVIIGAINTASRSSPDIERFKKECPREYARYKTFTRAAGYFIVRLKGED